MDGNIDVMRTDLSSLAVDLRRMLRVQLKEFVHMIEDVEFEQGQRMFPDISKHTIVNRRNISTHVA